MHQKDSHVKHTVRQKVKLSRTGGENKGKKVKSKKYGGSVEGFQTIHNRRERDEGW